MVALSMLMAPAGTASGDEPLEPRVLPEKLDHTTIGPGQSRERLHLKLQEGSGVRLRDGTFVSITGRDVGALREVLTQYPGTQVERMFSRPEAELAADERLLEAKTGKDLADLNLWYRLVVGAGAAPEALVDALNRLDIVEIAYPEPLPVPPPVTPDYEDDQGYLDEAPGGIDAELAWTRGPGGRGSGVKVVDIEYWWNFDHEDLSKAVGALIPNGTPAVPDWPDIEDDLLYVRNHGTAVLGEMVADRNGLGVSGIVYAADLAVINAYNVEDGYDLADAIDLARANTDAGDVILIEQQTSGPSAPCGYPDAPYIPVEYYMVWFDAIQTATAAGRVVVEAAGNGDCDLDHGDYGGAFDRTMWDSGAIIVGAGAAPGCTAPPRSRLWFSSYGSRVDLQGWGECVVTAGYGDKQGGPESEWYTNWFSGTSSASPIVAGAAAAVQGQTLATSGGVLTPAEMRGRLVTTGTPQDTSVGGHIGPLPNLASALARPVGGIAELPGVSGSSGGNYVAVAGLAAAALAALAAGAWYARRRWVR
jgi:subtilisin family serine protease